MEVDIRTKVYFEFFNTVFDEEYVESVWAIPVDVEKGLYKLDNVPFFVIGYSVGDVVWVQANADELIVKGLSEESGNTTVQIISFSDEQTKQIQEVLTKFGCDWEGSHILDYFSVNVPFNLDYRPIKEYLEELEKKEIIGYREACLAHAVK